jgi:transcriptional regulator with XRE-family HTH domain
MGKCKLGDIRRTAGLSQQDLSIKSGVKITTIQKLESGANDLMGAKVGTVLALARALETTVEDLVKESEERE